MESSTFEMEREMKAEPRVFKPEDTKLMMNFVIYSPYLRRHGYTELHLTNWLTLFEFCVGIGTNGYMTGPGEFNRPFVKVLHDQLMFWMTYESNLIILLHSGELQKEITPDEFFNISWNIEDNLMDIFDTIIDIRDLTLMIKIESSLTGRSNQGVVEMLKHYAQDETAIYIENKFAEECIKNVESEFGCEEGIEH